MSLERLEADAAPRVRAAGARDPPRPLRRPRERPRAAPHGLPPGRAGRHLRRADPGRRGIHRPARRLPAGPARALRRARHPARARRGPVGHRPDRPDVRLRALGRRTATSSAWPRGSPTACPWARSWRGPRSWTGPAAVTPPPSAATPSPAPRPWRRSDLVETRYRANAERRGRELLDGPRSAWPHATPTSARSAGSA